MYGAETSFIEINKSFIQNNRPLCIDLMDFTSSLNDKTIYKGAKSILSFSEEFEKYNSLIEGGRFEDVNFKEDVESCLNSMNRQLNKHKKISLIWTVEGNCDPVLSDQFTMKGCFPSWKLLSTILIDNAVKYAPSETDIIINLHQTQYRKTIEITNFGPLLNVGEEGAIFMLNENYRGKNAIRSGVEGQGIGLKLAKLIILAHQWRDATIFAHSEPSNVTIGGIPYGKFTVSFSIRNEGTMRRNDDLVRDITSKLNEFLSHEFIRINPLLSKHAFEMLEDSFSRKKEYIQISQKLRKETYNIYYNIMNHLIMCEFLWENISTNLRTSEEMRSSSKRFDNQLFDTLNRFLLVTGNDKIKIDKRGRETFSFSPMYTSLYLFFFILSQNLVNSDFEGVITIITSQRDIQILPPEGECFNEIQERDRKILDAILYENKLQMSCDNKFLYNIERL